MKLPPAWEAIADAFAATGNYSAEQIVRNAVERCYALANKPVRALTSAEITEEYQKTYPADKPTRADFTVIRAILAAHQRKQQEPETVTFRAARNRNDHSEIYMAKAYSDWTGSNWEWLPGEPQTIEVKLP